VVAEPDGDAVPEGTGADPADPDALARRDPIGALAAVAGYDDPERWWEDVVEHQIAESTDDPMAPFEAIASAMGVVRQAAPEPPPREKLHEDRREAHMRQALRTARRTHDRVAVVCGAWHVPALTDPLPPVAIDSQRNIVDSRDKTVVLLGVEDLIIVEADDALLVCRRDRAQEVGKIPERLRRAGLESLT